MEKLRLHRDGMKDLVFQGELLGSSSTRWIGSQEQTRWNEYELYKTKGGKYVLAKIYKTCWQGEVGSEEAEVYTLDGLRNEYSEEMSNAEYRMFAEACEKDPDLEYIRDDVII